MVNLLSALSPFAIQAIFCNLVALLLITIILLHLYKKNNASLHRGFFLAMCVINIFQCIIEPSTIVIDKQIFTGARTISIILNTILFVNSSIFSFLWYLYAYAKVNHRFDLKGKKILVLIPVIIMNIFLFINCFTPIVFEITAENEYKRGYLFYFYAVFNCVYLFVGLLCGFFYRKKGTGYSFFPVLTFLFPVVICFVLQFIFSGISLMFVGSAIGLVAAYISSIDEISSTDSLTQLFSRYYFDHNASDFPKLVNSNNKLAGYMIDVDDLKEINDVYGHIAGDDAIKSFANIIKKVVGVSGRAFRYGGDEFVVIMPVNSKDDVKNFISLLFKEIDNFNKSAQKKYKLNISLGYTLYQEGEDIDKFVSRMDNEMYKIKKRKKEKAGGVR